MPPRATLKFYMAWWIFIICYFGSSIYFVYEDPRYQSVGEIQVAGSMLMLGILSFPFTLIPLLRRRDQFITWLFRAVLLPICYGMLGIYFAIALLCTADFFIRR